MFETKLVQLQEAMEKKLSEKVITLQGTIDVLTKRVNTLEKQLADEKEKVEKLAQEVRIAIPNNFDEVKNSIDAEKVARLEKETQILKKMADDANRAQERTEHERQAREQSLVALREEAHKKEVEKLKHEQVFKQQVVEEMDMIRHSVKQEAATREANEEHIVATVDQIVQQVQESLSIVAKN